jgi:hypothetical protein
MNTVQAGISIATGLALTDLGVQELWGRYFTLGGTHTRLELATYLSGETAWSEVEHDLAARALNDYCTERGLNHRVTYSSGIRQQEDRR